LAATLFPEASDDVVRRVLRRVENRLTARTARGFSTATLGADALVLIKRGLGHEARRHSTHFGRRQSREESVNEFLARAPSRLTYFEALTCRWLRAGVTLQEIAAEQRRVRRAAAKTQRAFS
jgi:hypothetical protein